MKINHHKVRKWHISLISLLVIASIYKGVPIIIKLLNNIQSNPAHVNNMKTTSISSECETAPRPFNEKATVARIIDGDTIEVKRTCGHDKIRFIGINTPESVDPRRPVQCFGKEASYHLSELIKDKEILISGDESQSIRDIYNRLLGYIFIENKNSSGTTSTNSLTNINQKMISDGYAYEYTYKVPYVYQKEFKQAQKTAKLENLGLWSSSTCNGLK